MITQGACFGIIMALCPKRRQAGAPWTPYSYNN